MTTPTKRVTQIRMDWQQIALNGGPPCFHIDHESPDRYCGRAQRWDGHDHDHKFVSLDGLLASVATRMRAACVAKVKELIEVWAAPDSDLGDEVSGFRIDAANDIVEAIESLTLDQAEQEKSK